MSTSPYELIPGTALPIGDDRSWQSEGRGQVVLTPGRNPAQPYVSQPLPEIDPGTLALVKAAISLYDRQQRRLKTIYDSTAGIADATTGNLVLPLFTCPGGCEAHVDNVTVDAPLSTTITPSAPYSNAASFAYLAIVQGGAGAQVPAANADTLRRGLAAFAPNGAAGPIIPGQWTFNDSNSPVMFGGDGLYFVLHGGSIAALQSLSVQVSSRIELYGFESGQL